MPRNRISFANAMANPIDVGRVKLDRLGISPRLEIIEAAAKSLDIEINLNTRTRIARVSDGFPHFIHLICEKLFWLAYEQGSPLVASAELYEKAVARAVDVIEPHLKLPYEKATRKYSNDYEEVIWAAADTHELSRPSRAIYESYLRIMKSLDKEPMILSRFHNRMNNLKKESHGSLLIGSRQGWYEFREKMQRGYARMRAAQVGVELDAESPLQARKFVRRD